MKQREVIFYSEGTRMVGTIYLPDDYKEGVEAFFEKKMPVFTR